MLFRPNPHPSPQPLWHAVSHGSYFAVRLVSLGEGMQHLLNFASPHPYPFPVQGRERGTCSNFKAIGDNTFTPTQCGEHPVRRGPFIPYFPKFFLKTFIQLLFSSDLILYSFFCRILIRIQRRKLWLNNLTRRV